MFWKPVARWISAVPLVGKWWNASSGSVEAPCWTAPANPYSSRATVESRLSVSKSILTVAIVPSGSGTPPWLVPVWMLTLLMPEMPEPWSMPMYSSR